MWKRSILVGRNILSLTCLELVAHGDNEKDAHFLSVLVLF